MRIGRSLLLSMALMAGCRGSGPGEEYAAALKAYDSAVSTSPLDFTHPAYNEVLTLLERVPADDAADYAAAQELLKRIRDGRPDRAGVAESVRRAEEQYKTGAAKPAAPGGPMVGSGGSGDQQKDIVVSEERRRQINGPDDAFIPSGKSPHQEQFKRINRMIKSVRGGD